MSKFSSPQSGQKPPFPDSRTLLSLCEADFRTQIQILLSESTDGGNLFSVPNRNYLKSLALCRRFYNQNPLRQIRPCAVADLARLCADLAFCADLCTQGKSVTYSGVSDCPCVCAVRPLRWAVLNLLSEFLHRPEVTEVEMHLCPTQRQTVLAVKADSRCVQADFDAACAQKNSALGFCKRCAALHGGQLLLQTNAGRAAFLFTVRALPTAGKPNARTQSFDELLSDRFSDLYAALLG